MGYKPVNRRNCHIPKFDFRERPELVSDQYDKEFFRFCIPGLVRSMTLGISLCEQVGLLDAVLRKSMANVLQW